ncbi:MAG UNVERIFIED_CONTAM: precorrin-6A/cobalt-precorrin-6A reductase [Microcystis novacekii LVE1205-3]|jgi:precorrin-6A/cobalt-precorrin-6A reductase
MNKNKRVLILGGTGEAAALAAKIAAIPGIDAIASFAGRTQRTDYSHNSFSPGGFGGATGLANYLRQEGIDCLIDATHPFAAANFL